MAIKPGLYDLLITAAIREQLNATSLKHEIEQLEETSAPEYLARHIAQQIRLALKSADDASRIELVNSILERFTRSPDPVSMPGELLKAIHSSATAPPSPASPLSISNLIMNANGEPSLGNELMSEMQSADRVLMLVSFIQWRGWQRLKVAFEELAHQNKPVRILTTTYMGASDYSALETISKLPNVEMKVSLDGSRRRLHAKAWLFDRLTGFSSAYVGSANLSGPALEDGIEWTVKLSQVEAPHLIDKFRSAFETLWEDRDFELFVPTDVKQCERLQLALESARPGSGSAKLSPTFFDLKPHPYQERILNQLEAERLDRNQFRNLVVAPTGTGKTLVSAFDYQRQIPASGLRPRLLFLAHREEILNQSREVFRHVLRDGSFGELLTGGARLTSHHYLFSTIQSFESRGLLEREAPDYWDFVVLDEAHHAAAESYDRILNR